VNINISSCGLLVLFLCFSGCGGTDNPGTPVPGDNVPPAAVDDLAVVSASADHVKLAWTSTGDDGTTGTAQSYEIRYANYPADVYGWNNWNVFSTSVAARNPGQVETVSVTGLTESTAYVFRLKVIDDAGNSSDVSNPVVATAAEQFDTSAPDPVSDLTVWSRDNQDIVVAWTPAADDGPLGLASGYEIRYSDHLIDQSNWSSALEATAPVPGSGGNRDMATLSGIETDSIYYIAMRACDDQENWSPISNVLQIDTDQMRTWYILEDGSGDMPSIQDAINAAGVGDLILVAPGRYTWTNQNTEQSEYKDWAMVMFWRGVDGFTLRSESGPAETILDAEGNGRVMELQADNNNVIVDGFTLTGGDANVSPQGYQGGGALVLHLTGPLISNCVMTENMAKYGDALEMAGECEAVFENCRFIDNEAEYGGALYGIKSHLMTTFSKCVFAGNTASVSGGAVVSDTTAIHLVECQVYDNQAGDIGGAFLFYRSNPSEITRCTIANNRALNSHAIQLGNGSQLTIESSIIAENTFGGAFIVSETSTLDIGCSVIYGHSGGDVLLPEINDTGGNFYLDPLFVDGEYFDYHLLPGSPCLPGNHPSDTSCGQIGALGTGSY